VAPGLLLDEMLSGAIAEQLRSRGRDVRAVVEDRALVARPDEEILAAAAAGRRALVTANIKDFVPLDQRYKASGQTHAGLVLVSAKTFPQDRTFIGVVVGALDKLIEEDAISADAVVFLRR
jgi:predicted nuclease of predicted toxin-antitoxin system